MLSPDEVVNLEWWIIIPRHLLLFWLVQVYWTCQCRYQPVTTMLCRLGVRI